MSSPAPETSASHARVWWPRRIGWRLGLGFGLLVSLMLLALTVATVQMHQLSEMMQRFATGDMQRLLRVQALSLQSEGVGVALIRLMDAPRENRVMEYTDVDERNRRIDGIIESLASELRDLEQEKTLSRLIASRAVYADAFIATVDEIEAGELQVARKLLNDRVNPALKAMLLESNALLQRERERVEAQLTQAQEVFDQAAMGAGILSLIAVVVAAGLAWRTTASVVRPLAQLESGALRVAQGDYAGQVPATRAQEVDRVGQAINTMANAVAQREQHIVHMAFVDTLTDLPNRSALLKTLTEAGDAPNSLVLMDLARLKTINETLGYATGDTLINELGRRATFVLEHAVSDSPVLPAPVLARLTGGTFAISFEASGTAEVEALRDQLEAAMAAPVSCGGYSVDLSLAYGMASTCQTGGGRPVIAKLLRDAEVALHSAKSAAQRMAWYSEAQEAARLGHLSLLSDLRQAVADNQLQMWLQPKFSLSTGLAVGAEALVRWQHPQRGFVSPAEFVPFAEQTGYICAVTGWMLGEALRTLAAWAPQHPELSIAVNVSTRDLQTPGFARQVAHLVRDWGVNPGCLRLEITESGLMQDLDTSLSSLHALRDIGVQLSIDDFGTGYSSLAYLQRLPASELKIDRSFVDGVDGLPSTQKLVKAMIDMGHGLGMMVTAEGVETLAERTTLAGLGADVMQGYLGSRPLFGEALQTWLTQLPSLQPKSDEPGV